jgi:transposase
VDLDHFHVVKLMNDRLTEVRCKLHRELQDTMGKNILKGRRTAIRSSSTSEFWGSRQVHFDG